MTTRDALLIFISVSMLAWIVIFIMVGKGQTAFNEGIVERIESADSCFTDFQDYVDSLKTSFQTQIDSLKELYAGSGELALTAYAIADKGRSGPRKTAASLTQDDDHKVKPKPDIK